MKNRLLICLTILLFIFSCDDRVEDNFSGTYPCCFQPYIDKLLSMPPLPDRFKLIKYYYNNQYGYEFSPALYSTPFYDISNENCGTICSSGGVVGGGCAEWENADFIEVVWEDPR